MDVYQRGHVTVDDNFARFGSKSYAINKITSVDVRMNETRRIAWIFFIIIGAVVLLNGLTMLAPNSSGNAPASLTVGAVLLGIGLLMYRNRITRSFTLLLATAAGEVQALVAPNGDAIEELRGEIERRVAAK